MKFPYTRLPNGIKRPIIRIALEHNGKEVPYFGLIDSGADMNLVHGELADLLGLDLEAGEKHSVSGIVADERRDYYIHEMAIKVGGWVHNNVKVGFMSSLSKNGHGLLGQYGFFDIYSVKFTLHKSEIELKEHGELPTAAAE